MKRSLGILGILLTSFLLVTGSVLALQIPTDWETEERQLEFTHDQSGFRFESKRLSDLGDDTLVGAYSIPERSLTLTFVDQRAENVTATQLSVLFQALVEYRDADGDGAYGVGDQIVQRVRLSDLPPPTKEVTMSGSGGRVVKIAYDLPSKLGDSSDTGAFNVRFWIQSKTDAADGQPVAASHVRMKMELLKFPFQTNASRVALEKVVAATRPIEDGGSAFWLGTEPNQLFYEWTEESRVDGATRPVHVTLLASPDGVGRLDQSTVVLDSFERGQDLSHESRVGARPADAEPFGVIEEFIFHGDWRFYGAALGVACLLIGVTTWRRIHRA